MISAGKRSQSDLLSFGINNPLYPDAIRNKTTDEVEKMKRQELEKFDVTKYVGTKAQIVVAEVRSGKYGEVIFLQTNPIPLKDGDKLPDGKQLSASIMLGLHKADNGELVVGVDSKTDKWLKGKGINVEKDFPDTVAVGTELKALLGKQVTCQKNENGFLEIA